MRLAVVLTIAILLSGPAAADAARVPTSFDPLTLTASAFPTTGAFPLNVTLSANATGGWPPYTYAWSFGDGSANGSGPSVFHTYRWAAQFRANVSVTDSVGETTTISVAVLTHAAALTVTLSALPSSLGVDHQTYLETSVQGGTAPFAYAWSGLPSGCAALPAENLSCTPTQSGTFVIDVTVTDALGQHVNATTLLLVTGPPPVGGSPKASGTDWTPVILGGVALVAVLAVALGIALARRRRKGAP